MEAQNLSCTLRGPELLERFQEWKRVASRAESRVVQDNALIAVYPADPPLLAELRRLIEAEKDCCAFLAFHVEEKGDRAIVRMEVPEGMEEVLTLMMAGVESAAGRLRLSPSTG